MLDIKNAIRIEQYTTEERIASGRAPYLLYIFTCIFCEKEVKSTKSYCKKHSGKCRKCSALFSLKKAIKVRTLRPYESKLNYLKNQDTNCTLTYEEYFNFSKIKNCHYCEKIIEWKKTASTHHLDRKENNLTHSRDNCVVCCTTCNLTKGNRFSYNEFLKLAPILKEIQKNRDIKDN